MNTEKYIEMAIFVITTTLLSATLGYFANKKVYEALKKRKARKNRKRDGN